MERIPEQLRDLYDSIQSRKAVLSVIGLGYVGLPLAARFANAGFTVVGIDVDENRIRALNRGKRQFIGDTCVELDLPCLVREGIMRFSTDYTDLSKSSVIVICVDTPLDKRGKPDLGHIIDACEAVKRNLRRGMLVVLESSIYPGFTRSVMKSILEKSGLKAGEDFALAYSPERIDPGNSKYSLENIPKIVGGIDEFSAQITVELYRSILQAGIVKVSDTTAAEATKMIENAYRMVNISLMNELSSLFERIGVDAFEVVRAAATKPFGYHPFLPGPGIGGHCIPKDPLYLEYVARKNHVALSLIEASFKINQAISEKLVRKLMLKLKEAKKDRRETVVAVAGIAYKADVNDPRSSPAIPIVGRLKDRGVRVSVYDPYVDKIEINNTVYRSASSLSDAVKGADAVIFVTDHTAFKKTKLSEIRSVMARDPILYDTRGMFRPEVCFEEGFVYIGLGRPDMAVQRSS